MMLSFFLAKLIGIYALIKGVALITKRNELTSVVEDFFKDKTLMLVAGAFEIIFGLIIVLSHNVWINAWPVVITIIGWVMLIEGVIIAVVPSKKVARMFKIFENKNCYTIGAIVALVVGAYLTMVGFSM